MSEEKIVVGEKTTDLTILKGDAVVEQNPLKIVIDGNIGAPWQFLEKKLETYGEIDAHVLVDIDGKRLTLNLNEKDANGLLDTVTGALRPNKLIAQLEINTGNRFNQKQMIEMLRKNRAYFMEELKCGTLITQLRSLVGKIEKRIEISDDLKGNTANKLQTGLSDLKVDTNFQIEIPIFAGHRAKYQLNVEVAIDVSEGYIMFYLLSDDLYVLEVTESQKLIDAEIAHFEEWGCSVIQVL